MTATTLIPQLPSIGDKIQIVYFRKDNRLTDTSGIFKGISGQNSENWIIRIGNYTWEISNIIEWRPTATTNEHNRLRASQRDDIIDIINSYFRFTPPIDLDEDIPACADEILDMLYPTDKQERKEA